jgi:hypothetical protein
MRLLVAVLVAANLAVLGVRQIVARAPHADGHGSAAQYERAR